MRLSILPFALSAMLFGPLAFGEIAVKELANKIRVTIDGQLFTEFRYGDAPHVYYYPLLGPGGVSLTRSWPMENPPDEEHDHLHHRSMWFSHGDINGVDFWTELPPGKSEGKHPIGKIVFEKVLEAKSGADAGVLTTLQKWMAPDGSVPVTSTQSLRVYQRPKNERLFDFEVTLTAGDKDVVFGDTKEGTFGIRLAESMRLKQPKAPGLGRILNSEGLRDDKAWGQHARWVDMSGPADGKIFGITIFDHPSNLRHPTRWHARDYGLFAASPFCEVDMDKTQPKGAGDHKLPAGKSLTFKYRVLLHEDHGDPAKLAERFSEYAKESR